jgi:hypothetical protein
LATATRSPGSDPLATVTSTASPTVATILDDPIHERPLTENEISFLQSIVKKGKVPALRVFGVLTSVMALALVAAAALGLPLDPSTYTPLVLVTGFLGLGLGGASRSIRNPINRVLAAGKAREVYGVPEITNPRSRLVQVGLAGLTFQLRPVQAEQLFADRMNKVAYAEGGRVGGAKGRVGGTLGLVLEWNGTPVSKRETFLVRDTSLGSTK